MPALSTCNLTASNRKAALIAHAWEGGDRIDRKTTQSPGQREQDIFSVRAGQLFHWELFHECLKASAGTNFS